MRFFGIIFRILLVLILLPVEIFLSVIGAIHISFKMIVALSEGKSLEEIHNDNIAEQLGKIEEQVKQIEQSGEE